MFSKLSHIQHEDGFTLIELLVVILIIGILAGIAIPVFLNQQKAAINTSVKSDLRNAKINVATFVIDHPEASWANDTHATGGSDSLNADTVAKPMVVVSDEDTTVAVKFISSMSYTVEAYNSKTNFTYNYNSGDGTFSAESSGLAESYAPGGVNDGAIPTNPNTPGTGGTGNGETTPTTPPATTAPPVAAQPTKPTVVSNPSASGTTNTTAELNWAAVKCNVGTAKYTLKRTAPTAEAETVLTTTDTTLSDLTKGTTYTYSVAAFCELDGVKSEASEPASFTFTTKSDPTVALTYTFDSSVESWSASSSSVAVTNVTNGRNGTKAAQVGIKSGSGSVSNLGMVRSQSGKLENGKRYTMKAWVYHNSPYMKQYGFRVGTTYYNTVTAQQGQWQEISYTFTFSDKAGSSSIDIMGIGDGRQTSFMVDDVTFLAL